MPVSSNRDLEFSWDKSIIVIWGGRVSRRINKIFEPKKEERVRWKRLEGGRI